MLVQIRENILLYLSEEKADVNLTSENVSPNNTYSFFTSDADSINLLLHHSSGSCHLSEIEKSSRSLLKNENTPH